ncbi:MAG: hypothetical protein H6700_05455 [Myxococcales bacterium]|nr:hypothetical protein [Myxococcales bacterium]
MRVSPLFVLPLLASLTGCGTDSPVFGTFGDVVSDVGTGDGGGGGASCEQHSDCAGGEVCREGVCVAVDARVCEPGAGSCDGNVAVVCNDAGTSLQRINCGDDACVAGTEGATCLSQACDAGEVGCIDARTPYQCVDGTRQLGSCGGDTGCVAGECQAQVCEPRSRTCDGDTVVVCDAAGLTQSTVRCDLVPACQSAAGGCECVEGTCLPLVCEPGGSRCDGDDVLVCNATGSAEVVSSTCSDGFVCVAGQCTSDSCEIGSARCVGESLVTCDGSGRPIERNCAAEFAWCDATAGACVPQVCTPGTTECTAAGDGLVICDGRGTSSRTESCPSSSYCNAGVCQARVCSPGERRCDGGDAYVCAANGSGFALAQRCASDETCEAGVCVGGEPECTSTADCPAPRGRCEGTVLVSYTGNGACTSGTCVFDAVTRRTDCAATSRTCSAVSLSCETPSGTSCTTDSNCPGGYCVARVCVDCRTSGDCAAGEVCVDGECTPCTCPSGFVCDATGECVEVATACTSDAQCQSIAASIGASPDGVACDPTVGCYTIGRCGGDDPLGASCPAGTTCESFIDLLSSSFIYRCKGCDTADAGSCRDGETCQTPLLPIPDSIPYCSDGGGFFP